MNPGGEFLFVVHVVSDSVTAMARAPDGSLALVPGSTQFIGSDARKAVATDDFLFVTDDSSLGGSSGVLVYQIQTDGLLTEIPGSPFPAGVRPQDMVLYIQPLLFGDGDGDGDIDLVDFALYVDCVTGPNAGPVEPACEPFDAEPDGDVDFHDLAAIQRAFEGH